MVFKKPYAFFIKYFRHINFVLSLLFIYLAYKLNILREVVGGIYRGGVTNYSSLNSSYIGFGMYLLIFIIILILIGILLLLRRKNKPLKDYLFAIIYSIIIFIYLLFISNVFVTLDESIIEQTTLKLYSDISFLIIVPTFYFVIKFLLIVIGFNLSKFNFTKDIIELKQDENDNEEVELILDKNTYKYKRSFRKWLREFRYYFLENKFLIGVIALIIICILGITFFSFNIFNSNKVSVGENFNAGTFTYKINEIYETQYDLNYNIVKDDSKFVIVNFTVRNNNSESSTIDFKRIRLLYGKNYVYANNYFNKFFLDLGIPYNNETIKSGESNSYVFIFKVPSNYTSNNYTLKFYDKLTVENEETIGSYKEIKVNAEKIDKTVVEKTLSLNENTVFNKKRYGSSNITLANYNIASNYIYKNNDITSVIDANNINNILLILDYKLSLDEDNVISEYFKTDTDFFNNFVNLTYTYNGKEKYYNKVSVVGNIDNKILLSVPYELQNASNINIVMHFRDVKIIYKLK